MECPACGYVRLESDDAPEWQCPDCKRAYNKVGAGRAEYENVYVPRPERPRRPRPAPESAPTDDPNRALVTQLIGIIGSALLVIGPFAPYVSAPIVGNVTLFKSGAGDGVFILGFGVLALLFSFARRYTATAISGALAAAVLSFTFFDTQQKLGDMADNPFADAISFQWGAALIVLGIILTLAPAAMVRR